MSINLEEQTTAHAGHPMAEPENGHAHSEHANSEQAACDAMPEGTAAAGGTPHAAAKPESLMSELRRLKCDKTIAKHVSASVGAGFIPVPIVDFAAVTAVQMDMVYRLCKLYDVNFSTEAARTAIVTLIGASVPGLQARFFSSGLKLIPGVGTVVGMFATPAVSGAATYAVGRVFVQHLETGGSLMTFDASKMKEHFERALQHGKDMTSRATTAKA